VLVGVLKRRHRFGRALDDGGKGNAPLQGPRREFSSRLHLLVCSHLHAALINNHTLVAAAEGNADQPCLIAVDNRVCLSRASFTFTLFQSRRRGHYHLTTLNDRQLAGLFVKYDIVFTVLNKRSVDLGIR